MSKLKFNPQHQSKAILNDIYSPKAKLSIVEFFLVLIEQVKKKLDIVLGYSQRLNATRRNEFDP